MERENAAADAAAGTIQQAIDVLKHQGEMDMQQQQTQQMPQESLPA